MNLLTQAQMRQLLANGQRNQSRSKQGLEEDDFWPVVKVFVPWGGGTWLLTELDPDEPDIAFGLCDPGLGTPELGSVRLSEMTALRGPGGLRIERDRWFRATKTLSAYAAEAHEHRRIMA
jgi:Protein of unknown function (DUF2958)